MISDLRLQFGRVLDAPVEQINVTAVTVFVGPTNSGKSKVLREIDSYCRTGVRDGAALILDALTFQGLGDDQARSAIEALRSQPGRSQSIPAKKICIGSRRGQHFVAERELLDVLCAPHGRNKTARFCAWFLTHYTLMLDGKSRIELVSPQQAGDFQLVSPQQAGDFQRSPQSSLQVLFGDDARRKEARRIIFEAIGSHFVIDPTKLGQLRIRFSTRPPVDDLEERGIHSMGEDPESADYVKPSTGDVWEFIKGIRSWLVAPGRKGIPD